MTSCLLALGSNLGDRAANLQAAVDELRRHPAVAVLRISSFYETIPVGGPPGQSKFFNAVAIIETQLAAGELMSFLLEVERQLGRERNERWGARTIDLDLLFYGNERIQTSNLIVPHPELHRRRFVLEPAAEIAADWHHPVLDKPIEELRAALAKDDSARVGMRVVFSPTQIQATILELRRAGRSVGLVPTMGALHAGHLSLVHTARQRADVVAATIFVNPTQFSPGEDLGKYPRTLESDLQALSAAGCDFVFVPSSDDIYPPGFSTYVEPPAVAAPLEGVNRPGHFRGVATVVLKLFHLIPADFACFGQKDYQQLLVIRRMVEDLALPNEIVACPTVREADGLAMSSRNRYLSPAERHQALALSRALQAAERFVASGEKNSAIIVARMRKILSKAGIGRVDYVVLADPETLSEKSTVDGATIALIAAQVGAARLIDNRLLNTP
jgi:pantoate--beta-alanine ligase